MFQLPVAWSQNYHIANFNVRDGLSQNRVNCIFQDSRSMIWFGTSGGGISRYDGINFKTLNSSDGLIDNRVISIHEQSSGNLLIGTSSGLCSYNGYHFKTINEDLKVNAMAEAGANGLWLACDNGLINYKAGVFFIPESIEPIKGKKVNALINFQNGLLIGTNTGLYFFDGQKQVRKFEFEGPLVSANISDIQGSENDIIWISTLDQGLFRLFNGTLQKIDNPYSQKVVSASSFDDESVAIALEEDGLIIYNFVYEDYAQILERDGLANDRLSEVIKDKWGNLWVATLGNGISKFSGKSIQKIGSQFGLPENTTNTVMVGSSGDIWFSHSSTKMGKYNGRNFFNYDQVLGFPNSRVTKIHEDKADRLWIGTLRNGIILKDSTGFQKIQLRSDMGAVTDISTDLSGRLWIATKNKGLINIDFGKTGLPRITEFNTDNGIRENWIADILLDRADGIWGVTNSNGIFRISMKNSVVNYSVEDGLYSNNIKSLATDVYGNIWILYKERGISKFNPNKKIKTENFVLDGSLPNIDVEQMVVDGNMMLLVHREGIDKYSIGREGGLNFVGTIDFGGLNATLVSNINSLDYNDEKLWLGSSNGLIRVNLNQLDNYQGRPSTTISKVSLLNHDIYETNYGEKMASWYRPLEDLRFKNKENDLGFEFQYATANSENDIDFQWIMEGYDKEWSPPTKNNNVRYSNLPHGNYSFYVKASNKEGEYIAEPFNFRIKKAFYQYWWFRLGSVVLILGLIYFLYNKRVKRNETRVRKQKEELENQLSLLDLEQKALQLQMNPHFIFNSLNSIQGLIVKKKLDGARKYLNKFSSLMRSFLNHSRLESVSLQEEIDLLQNYLLLEQFSRGDKFEYEIILPKSDPDEIMIPPMMIQAFVENAIIHGINHIEGKGKIVLSFEEVGNKIKCIIDDNGIGRKAAEKMKSRTHDSTAIKVILDRLEIIHRSSSLNVLKIIDKLDKDEKAAGTRVELLLPILN